MNGETKIKKEKEELIEIYNSLMPSLKKQLVSTAKIIRDTQSILFDEYDINGNELHKEK